MKDKIIFWKNILIGLGLLFYVGILYTNWATVTVTMDNNVALFLVLLIWWAILYIGMPDFYIPKARLFLFLFWVFVIMFAHYWLQDDPKRMVFLADILKIIWAIITVAWPFGLYISDKVKKKKDEEKIEIIEV